jgi:hypothetical protein
LQDAVLIVVSFREKDDGHVAFAREIIRTDMDGNFQLQAPVSSSRKIVVYESWTPNGKIFEQGFAPDREAAPVVIHIEEE